MPPRGLEPTGIILVDKPAGPSSFAVVDRIRRRTGARTGHAGTLDPFASGLLLLLSGRATKVAQRFVGLDKRYVTTIDLTARTATGDPEGEIVERLEALSPDELRERLEELRGDVELPVPAASAVKIGGERAYRLHRRGVSVEMPVRRSRLHVLELLGYTGGVAELDLLVSSGTYVRSIADALGGHCVALRRTEVGPFSVDEADEERVDVLERPGPATERALRADRPAPASGLDGPRIAIVCERVEVVSGGETDDRDENVLRQTRYLADGSDAKVAQLGGRDLADSPEPFDRERMQKAELVVGRYDE